MDGDRLRFTAINYKESGMSEIVWATKGKRVERRVYVTFVSRNKQFAIYVTQQACGEDRKSTRLNSSHSQQSRMPSSA